MKFKALKIWQYRLPLSRPLPARHASVGAREGFFICLTDEDGIEGWGEAAPLPGFSREGLTETLTDIRTLLPEVMGGECPEDSRMALDWMKDWKSCPSAAFGVGSAVLDALSRKKSISLARWLGSPSIPSLTGLIDGKPDEILSLAREGIRRGYAAFKLKVGAASVPVEVEKVHRLREFLPPTVKLRLDANSQWSLREAILFANSAGLARVDYIEDPVPHWQDVSAFFRQTGMAVALDGLLEGVSLDDALTLPGLYAIVLKPTLTGSPYTLKSRINACQMKNVKTVISSAFESGLGLTHLANWSCITAEPAGIGTYHWFSPTDTMAQPSFIHAPQSYVWNPVWNQPAYLKEVI